MSDVKLTGRHGPGKSTPLAASTAKTTSTATTASPPEVGAKPFNPKSATYHQALHDAGFITDAQLAAARSGERKAMENADKEALLIGRFNSSRPLTRRQATNVDGTGGTKQTKQSGTAFLERHRKRDELLRKNYEKRGYTFVHARIKNHNCLITSLLKHATKNYANDYTTEADRYRKKLNVHLKEKLTQEQKKRFRDDGLLDAGNIPWLLNEMAKDTTLGNEDLSVELWTANDEGEPISLTFGNSKTKVILFNSTDHFEAVLPPRQVCEKKGARRPAPATTTGTSATTTTTSGPRSSTTKAMQHAVSPAPDSKSLARKVTQRDSNNFDDAEFKFNSFNLGDSEFKFNSFNFDDSEFKFNSFDLDEI